ncbi:MAG: helix-turn-helix transcriptional regulator [Proteobacteria bacterium]|jgi:transcriptional regulator with XRE-family HTH domain|nr:helix-turn-helix transcriptional regulator [Pseudomonadota bacterium]
MSTTRIDKNDHFNETVATFGDRLAAAREAKGLTVEGLSEKLGVDARTVEDWESDADEPRSNRIQMLAGLLNVSIVWLISGESSGTSHVADTYARPTGVNDALGEISQLKATLSGALNKLEKLEKRLQEIE